MTTSDPRDPFMSSLYGGMRVMWADKPETPVQRAERELDFARRRIDELTKPQKLYVIVAEVTDTTVTILNGAQMVELARPSGLSPFGELKVGQMVKVVQNGGISGVVDTPLAAGPIVNVKQVIDDKLCEIALGPQSQVVPYPADAKPKPGDRVVLDSTGKVIVRNLGAGDTSRNIVEATGVDWDDIGGQAEAKRALRESVEEPHTNADTYAKFGMVPARGVLLWGPPGNGKTMLGKAAATALAKLHGAKHASTGFIYVKGPDLLDKFVGETEANIRRVFAQAREHKARAGYPAVIFIDECDALLGKRGARAPGFEGIERTVIPQFLSEMDGMFDSGAFVLLATNRPDTLDPAVVRDGRIDRKVEVKRPTVEDARTIFDRLLSKRPCNAKTLAVHAAGELFRDTHALAMVRCKDGKDVRFTLGHVASGAMVAGVVGRATQRTIRRALEAKTSSIAIGVDDINEAIAEVLSEQRDIPHTTELQAFCEPMLDRVVKVDFVREEKP